jgi:shikimate dehydrogenase
MSKSKSQGLPYAEVIGDPIAHSKSPLIHNFWLEQLDIEAEYRKTHVARDGLAAYFLSRRMDDDWLGCNVTIPHKVAVMDYVEDPSNIRGQIGAMNTIACETGGPLIGTNTDAGGFLQPLEQIKWRGSEAVLVGAGGAALAIGFALAAKGLETLTVIARDTAKGQALLDHVGLRGRVIGFADPLPATRLLINSSPLGMTGQPSLDLDLASLPEDATVYDIVYAPLETGLLRAARARELTTIDGLGMLIGQAALAFEILFDAIPPRDDNDAALRALLMQPAQQA